MAQVITIRIKRGGCDFVVSYVGEIHGSLYNFPTKEERRKPKANRRVRSDQVY